MASFHGWGSVASRLEPLRGGSLPITTKFLEISGSMPLILTLLEKESPPKGNLQGNKQGNK